MRNVVHDDLCEAHTVKAKHRCNLISMDVDVDP